MPTLFSDKPVQVIANSKSVKKTMEIAQSLAQTSEPILIIGERGTGKDFFAELIHRWQCREKLEKVDCANDLMKSLKGYFDNLRAEIAFDPEEAYEPGKLELATDGTVYLDRVHLTPTNYLNKIADIIEGKPYNPIGDNRILKPNNIQFIASCEPHPFTEQPEGYLDEHLRFVFKDRVIFIPPLYDRKADIPDFIRLFTKEINPSIALDFSDDFHSALEQYEWPNNLWLLKEMTHRIFDKLPKGEKITGRVMHDFFQDLPSNLALAGGYARKARCAALARELTYRDVRITGKNLYDWIEQFALYRVPYDINPCDVAEEVLRNICFKYFYNNTRLKSVIEKLGKEVIRRCNEENIKEHIILTNPLGLMKSSDIIIAKFRSVYSHQISPEKNTRSFEELAEFISKRGKKKKGAVVLLLDDFIGSGEQFVNDILKKRFLSNKELRDAIKSYDPSLIHFFMLYCVVYKEGLEKVKSALKKTPEWLNMTIIPGDVLDNKDKAFDPKSSVFPDESVRIQAKEILVNKIGQHLDQKWPQGRYDMQALVVFEHNTPNNSLPVIWKKGYIGEKSWNAIFPRMGAG